MGCKNSNENNDELFYEDVNIERKFLTGIHFSKGAEGLEVQIAFATTREKKYERVANNLETSTEENQVTLESTGN